MPGFENTPSRGGIVALSRVINRSQVRDSCSAASHIVGLGVTVSARLPQTAFLTGHVSGCLLLCVIVMQSFLDHLRDVSYLFCEIGESLFGLGEGIKNTELPMSSIVTVHERQIQARQAECLS